jgi:hypothetical protein
MKRKDSQADTTSLFSIQYKHVVQEIHYNSFSNSPTYLLHDVSYNPWSFAGIEVTAQRYFRF